MEMPQMDAMSIVIATLLYVIIHFCWYSKWMFGPDQYQWLEVKAKDVNRMRVFGLISDFVRGLIIAFFLAFFDGYLNVTSVADGIFVSFCIWLGFVVTTQLSTVIWLKQPVKVFFIQTGVKFLSYLVMGGIIGA